MGPFWEQGFGPFWEQHFGPFWEQGFGPFWEQHFFLQSCGKSPDLGTGFRTILGTGFGTILGTRFWTILGTRFGCILRFCFSKIYKTDMVKTQLCKRKNAHSGSAFLQKWHAILPVFHRGRRDLGAFHMHSKMELEHTGFGNSPAGRALSSGRPTENKRSRPQNRARRPGYSGTRRLRPASGHFENMCIFLKCLKKFEIFVKFYENF